MIKLEKNTLLMIEPELDAEDAINDELTEQVKLLARTMLRSPWSYTGVHTCKCGATSTSFDVFLPDKTLTSSLMVHYISCHRGEIPASEMIKLKQKIANIGAPVPEETEKEFWHKCYWATLAKEHKQELLNDPRFRQTIPKDCLEEFEMEG